jgi:hypothetical protein
MLLCYNRRMKSAMLILTVTLLCGTLSAQAPPRPDEFFAGIYADGSREMDCISGPAGASFDIFAIGWVPLEAGLNYVTLRIDFPANIELSGRPALNDLITELIVIDYDDGTSEWTMLFSQCPSGWIELFSQKTVILDPSGSDVTIVGDDSMIRDCDFILNGLGVLGGLAVNDPACEFVSVENTGWGAVKSIFRQYR